MDSRPDELGIWLKARLYSPQHIPHVADASAYRERWVSWWTACQPAWRKGREWPLSREGDTGSGWGKLRARGQNGIFIVVMSTTWWAASLTSAEESSKFDEAIADVHWVFDQLLKSYPVQSTPDPPPPPTNVQKPTSKASWLVRPSGKRQSKPSYKVLEGS